MVRAGRVALRNLALDYGADLVYTEEIVDQKLMQSKRISNDILRTVDYVIDDDVVLRIANREKESCILQIGTNNAENATEVVKKFQSDVAAIDVNMGCPKPFSITGGMGAALLRKPDLTRQILESMVAVSAIPISCKVRLLDTVPETIAFIKMLEQCGISAIGVHGRHRDERPHHPNRSSEVAELRRHVSVPIIASGESSGISTYEDIENSRIRCNADSIMIAREALKHPSIFRPNKPLLSMDEEIRNYLRKVCEFDEQYVGTKYVVQRILGSQQEFDPKGKATVQSGSVSEICRVWGLQDVFEECKAKRGNLTISLVPSDGILVAPVTFPPKRLKTLDGSITPKWILQKYCIDQSIKTPTYTSRKRPHDSRFEAITTVNGKQFTSSVSQPNKKMAEQVSALVALHGLNIRNLLPGEWEK